MKRVYFSDVHLGVNLHSKYGTNYNWLNAEKADAFLKFLNYLNEKSDASEVVIVGDLVDSWVYPIDVPPPNIGTIFNAHGDILNAMANLTKNKEVVYLPGNHDMTVTKKALNDIFPNMIFGGNNGGDGTQYIADYSIAEHGHVYGMFNAPDPLHDNTGGLPLGHFVSRLVATGKAKGVKLSDTYRNYLAGIINLVSGSSSLGEAVFDAVFKSAGLGDADKEIAIDKKIYGKDFIAAITARDKYTNIYSDWPKEPGRGSKMIDKVSAIDFDKLNNFSALVIPLCNKFQTKIAIFGHTHEAHLFYVPDIVTGQQRIYANCGAWCDDVKEPSLDGSVSIPRPKYSYVETEVLDGDYRVRLMRWKDDGTKNYSPELDGTELSVNHAPI